MTAKDSKDSHHQGISRRDFLNGVSVAIGGSLLGTHGAQSLATVGVAPPYPPALTGLRGSHPGSFVQKNYL